MKVGINGRFLVAKRTGVQRAAYNLIRTLIEIDRENEYVLFTGHDQLSSPDWDAPNVQVVASNLRHVESFRNHVWEQFTLPRLAKKHNVDILHSPANVAPIFYRGCSIVHIHDLCFVVNPQWYSFSFRTLYNFLIPRLARRATKVVTNSNNSRNDLLQYFGLDSEKVSLVYWAVDEKFLDQVRPVSHIRSDCDMTNDYILYVGSLEPRKNIAALIEAYEIMRSNCPDIKTKLILIGGESPLFSQVHLKMTKYRDDVIFKGFVDDFQLRDYYKNAQVVAYPSLYEGFGLPPLEAMASGVPVVTSRSSSIPEVVGDSAIMVDPRNPNQLAEALRNVLRDSQLRNELIEAGKQQVLRFNWYRVARCILSLYDEVYLTNKFKRHQFISLAKWKGLRQIEVAHQQNWLVNPPI